MNLADWILLGALLVSIVIGIIRGFTREFFGLITWVIAIIAAVLARYEGMGRGVLVPSPQSPWRRGVGWDRRPDRSR